jgi:hypothetical protein
MTRVIHFVLQLLHVSISRRFAFEELEREPFFESEE